MAESKSQCSDIKTLTIAIRKNNNGTSKLGRLPSVGRLYIGQHSIWLYYEQVWSKMAHNAHLYSHDC